MGKMSAFLDQAQLVSTVEEQVVKMNYTLPNSRKRHTAVDSWTCSNTLYKDHTLSESTKHMFPLTRSERRAENPSIVHDTVGTLVEEWISVRERNFMEFEQTTVLRT